MIKELDKMPYEYRDFIGIWTKLEDHIGEYIVLTKIVERGEFFNFGEDYITIAPNKHYREVRILTTDKSVKLIMKYLETHKKQTI